MYSFIGTRTPSIGIFRVPLNFYVRLFEEMDEFYQVLLVLLSSLEYYSLAVVGSICIRNEVVCVLRSSLDFPAYVFR